jgi:CBS domain containing-hemolysin-like protein
MFGNVMLLFIGLFVWIGAQTERLGAETKVAIEGLSSRDAAEVSIAVLRVDETLAVAARRLLAGAQRDFPVADLHGDMVGVLTRDKLIAALRASGGQGRVGDAMTRPVLVVPASTALSDVLARMQQAASQVAVLTEDRTVIGVVTAENVAELVMVRRALADYDAAHPA